MKKIIKRSRIKLLVCLIALSSIFLLYGCNNSEESSKNKELQRQKVLIQAAKGEIESDVLIKNVKIIDVYRKVTYEGNILIKDGIIIDTEADINTAKAKEVIDGQGKYAMPGLIEPHFHIDATLATPAAISHMVAPWGETTVVGETVDLAPYFETMGKDGVKAVKGYLTDQEKLPYRLLSVAPGKEVKESTTETILKWESTFGLGELESREFGTDSYLNKILLAKDLNKYITGHVLSPGEPEEVKLFSIAGLADDHQAESIDGVSNVLKNGILPQLNFLTRIDQDAVTSDQYANDDLLFSSDSIFIHEAYREGKIMYNVNTAISQGVNPIQAIRMGTLNAARSLGIEDQVGSITPGRSADIVLFNNLNKIFPEKVFYQGKLVAENLRLSQEVKQEVDSIKYPSSLNIKTTSSLDNISIKDIQSAYSVESIQAYEKEFDKKIIKEISSDGTKAKVFVKSGWGEEEFWLPITGGIIQCSYELGISKIIGTDRNNEKLLLEPRFIKCGEKFEDQFSYGINFKGSRYFVVGNSDELLLEALKTISEESGAAVAFKGSSENAILPLTIGGVASDLPGDEIIQKMNYALGLLEEAGVNTNGGWTYLYLWANGFYF